MVFWRCGLLSCHVLLISVNRKCTQGAPLFVLDTDMEGGRHGQLQDMELEGNTVKVLHVRRKQMRLLTEDRLHHASFINDIRMVGKAEFQRKGRRARGRGWDHQVNKMWSE